MVRMTFKEMVDERNQKYGTKVIGRIIGSGSGPAGVVELSFPGSEFKICLVGKLRDDETNSWEFFAAPSCFVGLAPAGFTLRCLRQAAHAEHIAAHSSLSNRPQIKYAKQDSTSANFLVNDSDENRFSGPGELSAIHAMHHYQLMLRDGVWPASYHSDLYNFRYVLYPTVINWGNKDFDLKIPNSIYHWVIYSEPGARYSVKARTVALERWEKLRCRFPSMPYTVDADGYERDADTLVELTTSTIFNSAIMCFPEKKNQIGIRVLIWLFQINWSYFVGMLRADLIPRIDFLINLHFNLEKLRESFWGDEDDRLNTENPMDDLWLGLGTIGEYPETRHLEDFIDSFKYLIADMFALNDEARILVGPIEERLRTKWYDPKLQQIVMMMYNSMIELRINDAGYREQRYEVIIKSTTNLIWEQLGPKLASCAKVFNFEEKKKILNTAIRQLWAKHHRTSLLDEVLAQINPDRNTVSKKENTDEQS